MAGTFAGTAGKPTYTVDLLRWYLGAPNEPIPASFAALHLPTTLATTAYADLPAAAGGPFPVILFSHGFGGYPEQSSFLTIHLATWGFVVVAPDHRSRDLAAVLKNTSRQCACDVTDLRAALQDVTAMDHAAGTLLSGKLDLTRVASLGHSAGGGAAISIAAQPGVKGFVAMAPVPGRIPPAGKPGLIMQGTGDQVVLPTDGVHVYRTLNTPKRLILIDSGGHNVFSDACVIGAAQGGLRAFIGNLNLPASFQRLALDGCSPPDVFPPTAWPLIDHAVTAQIRWALGIDPEPVGLGSDLNNAYTGVTAHVTSNP